LGIAISTIKNLGYYVTEDKIIKKKTNFREEKGEEK